MSNLQLRPLVRIGKAELRSILGKMLQYEQPYTNKIIFDHDACVAKSCPTYCERSYILEQMEKERKSDEPDFTTMKDLRFRLKELEKNCAMGSCPNCTIKRKYNNDNKTFNFYANKYQCHRLPKTSVKLYLLLCAIPQEMLGQSTHFIHNINANVLADRLGCTTITVEKSLHILESFHYISLCHSLDKHTYNIIISGYDQLHLTAKKGGSGYITLTEDMISLFLKISNVNALRLELIKILKLDETTLITKERTDNYLIHDLKNILPQHMNYIGAYEKIQQGQVTVFDSHILDGRLYFTLKDTYKLKINIDDFQLNNLPAIKECLFDLNIEHDEVLALNIAELSTQYHISLIKEALVVLKAQYIDQNVKIRNTGGLIRILCQRLYMQSIAS